ncbi:MAG: hypothetical protein IT236_10355 [Bacteroidia bacterium]|nr:hypothetical protein [Bacteroidia bacterium]
MKIITKEQDFHYDLHFASPDKSYILKVGATKYKLKRHTEATRKAAKKSNPFIALLPDERITHYASKVAVSQTAPQLAFVFQSDPLPGQTLLPMIFSHITQPTAASNALIKKRLETNHPNCYKYNSKLLCYGIKETLAGNAELVKHSKSFYMAMDTAVALAFQHNELLNNGSSTAAQVIDLIESDPNISNAEQFIRNQMINFFESPASDNNWVNQADALDINGNAIPGQYNYAWSQATVACVAPLIRSVLNTTKNDPALQSTSTNAGCYSVLNGTISVGLNSNISAHTNDSFASSNSNLDYVNLTPQGGLSVVTPPSLNGSAFSMQLQNNYVRWLGVYVTFYDAGGKVLTLTNWPSPMVSPFEPYTAWDTDTVKIVALVSSVNTIYGVPLGGDTFDVKFTWPEGASSATIMCGGLGQIGYGYNDWNTTTCALGTIMTCVFNFAIPSISLLFGAFIQAKQLKDLAANVVTIIVDIVNIILGGVSGYLSNSSSNFVAAVGGAVLNFMISNTAFQEFLAEFIPQTAIDETPVVGWIIWGINTAADLATIEETTVEVMLSPCVYEINVTDTINVSWQLSPDSGNGSSWPAEATSYQFMAIYNGTVRCMETPGVLSSNQSGPITVSLNGIPGLVQVKFSAVFYSDTGWIAGYANTDWMPAVGNNGSLLTLTAAHITQNVVPLTSATNYIYNESLSYNSQTGSRSWDNQNGAPVATVSSLNPENDGNYLSALLNISNNASTNTLGYAYTASGQNIPITPGGQPTNDQVTTFQSISSTAAPDSTLCFVPEGFEGITQLGINPEAINSPGTQPLSYYIDANNYIRPLQTGTAGTFNMNNGTSYGQFVFETNDSAYHPTGYVIGINTAYGRLQVVNISGGPVSDNQAPLSVIYGGTGTRPGLLYLPVAVAPAPNSALIVLENMSTDPITNQPINGRLQAFDLYGNPVLIFSGNSSVANLNTENEQVTLLDMAVESLGYIYVLNVIGDTTVAANYAVDIYKPDGTFLCQTKGITTAKITVDTWRTLYSLDYAVLNKTDGSRTEPGVSRWLPSTPGV